MTFPQSHGGPEVLSGRAGCLAVVPESRASIVLGSLPHTVERTDTSEPVQRGTRADLINPAIPFSGGVCARKTRSKGLICRVWVMFAGVSCSTKDPGTAGKGAGWGTRKRPTRSGWSRRWRSFGLVGHD